MPELDLDAHLAQHSASLPDQWLQEPRLEDEADERLDDVLKEVRLRLLKVALVLSGGDVPISREFLDEAYECLIPRGPDADWLVLNRRRVRLIRKDISGTLSKPEGNELDQLQAQADQYVAATAPRPLEELRELEGRLRKKDGAGDAGSTPPDG
jgi:hypothetical protein